MLLFTKIAIMKSKPIRLYFTHSHSVNEAGKHVRDGLSAALRTGNNLWVSCDERCTLERLTLTGPDAFGKHQSFQLNEYLSLTTGDPCEIDIEGLAVGAHYLWLVGSHSLARKKPRKEDSPARQIRRLAKIKEDPNRFLLARIPLVRDAASGDYSLQASCPHPEDPSLTLTAAQLLGAKDGRSSQLLEALAEDIHFKDFLRIPGKDNGFDIEGLAVSGEKIYLGIRGPVLRGWAVLLEIQVKDAQPGFFALQPGRHGLYKKHFLLLEGMGVRELRIVGDDLLVLAGPTMDLDGTIAVYRWRNGVHQEEEAIVHRKELERLFDVPHGYGSTRSQDKAEGMALFDDKQVLIVFDSPTDARKPDEDSIVADLFPLPQE